MILLLPPQLDRKVDPDLDVAFPEAADSKRGCLAQGSSYVDSSNAEFSKPERKLKAEQLHHMGAYGMSVDSSVSPMAPPAKRMKIDPKDLDARKYGDIDTSAFLSSDDEAEVNGGVLRDVAEGQEKDGNFAFEGRGKKIDQDAV